MSGLRDRIACEWGPSGIEAAVTAAGPLVVVVFDVLIFSTAAVAALEAGVWLHPFGWGDPAGAAAHAAARGALVAGRRGEAEPNASPTSLTRLPAGTRVVVPSPNGATCALAARRVGVPVVLGALVNAQAVAEYVRAADGAVVLVPAGERWPDGSLRPALEDWLGVGAVAAALPWAMLGEEARAARLAYEGCRTHLPGALAATRSGQELIARGYREDVEGAASVSRSSAIPRLGGDGYFGDASSQER